MGVHWKPITGFEKYYMIGDNGQIYSLHKNKILSPQLNKKNGYLYVALCKPGYKKFSSLHRLAAMHFCKGYAEGLCVNHKDEVKTNNQASNLEWCTKAYNNSYNGKNDTCCKKVAQYTIGGVLLKVWNGLHTADRELNISFKNISAVCRGERKSAGGYKWRYANE